MRDRVWLSQIEEVLKVRQANAMEELGKLMEDVKSYPFNYNSYYTDIIIQGRQKRKYDAFQETLHDSTATMDRSYTQVESSSIQQG